MINSNSFHASPTIISISTVDQMVQTVKNADAHCNDTVARGFFNQMRALALHLTRQLFLTESYKNLGISPPAWLGVQQILESGNPALSSGSVSVRFWTERLEIYADPLFKDVLIHLAENAISHGIKIKNLVVTYHETREGLDLILEDDGIGIPADKKQSIFEYDEGGHAGIGLFICREILGVTGMTIAETGTEGNGARFVIHVPPDGYRIEGTGEDAPVRVSCSKPGNGGSSWCHNTQPVLSSGNFPQRSFRLQKHSGQIITRQRETRGLTAYLRDSSRMRLSLLPGAGSIRTGLR